VKTAGHLRAGWRLLRTSWQTRRDRWLLGGAALALAAALFEPSVALERQRFEHVVVFDITQSMNVPDQRLDGKPAARLAAAKEGFRRLLPALPCGSKVGWAVFTEHRSYLLIEPIEVCAHLDELRATLAGVDRRMAWVGGSEVAKGLHSALAIAKALPGVPSLVFVTDGHEAPPLNPRHRPAFDDQPGEVQGVIVGVGAAVPSPIPKTDLLGRPLGTWSADDVQQTDLRRLGRGASIGGERLVEDGPAVPETNDGALGATPGAEHLSALREPYLRLLAGERGLAYHHLGGAPALLQALTAPALARPVTVRADARAALGMLALLLLLARQVRGFGNKRYKLRPRAKRI
jgi:mxaL protein